MSALESLTPFNSVSAIAAEGGATVIPEPTPVPVVAVASDSQLAQWSGRRAATNDTVVATRSLGTGQENQASLPEPASSCIPPLGVETTADALLSFAPAAFSFQPDFEKLFNEIMGPT